MSVPGDRDPDTIAAQELAAHPEYTEVPLLEDDETVPPRPEEVLADELRSDPA